MMDEERQCYTWRDDGGIYFLTGDCGPHCADCGRVGEKLCDYPVGRGKTCDRSVCNHHSHRVGPNLDYCETHWLMWDQFSRAKGIQPLPVPPEVVIDCWLVCAKCGTALPRSTETVRNIKPWPKCHGKPLFITLTEPVKEPNDG